MGQNLVEAVCPECERWARYVGVAFACACGLFFQGEALAVREFDPDEEESLHGVPTS